MNQVQIEPAPSNVARSSTALRIVLVAVLGAAVLALALRIVDGPPFVDRVTIVNQSSAPLDVDVAGSRDGSWTPEGVALEGGATTFQEVVDQGDVWWFRLSSADRSVVVRVPREQLAQNGWRVTVPKSMRGTLATEGKRLD
ncbi:MAG TPA: hypothetical protein VFZ17_08640 [Acidimicrobiia bacterium]|nr:hypothetical protein [Acidimicrobiia bacterium]